MSETELAWAAGFIDGEGSITIEPHNGKWRRGINNFVLRLTVGNTVKAPIERLKSLFGGGIGYRTPRPSTVGRGMAKGVWYWRLNGKAAKALLKQLYSHFSVKQRHAAIAEVFPIGNGSKRHPVAIILQEECCKAVRRANALGVPYGQ